MKYLPKLFNTVLLALSLLSISLSSFSFAENMKKLGNMNVHYIALDTKFLTPEVAKKYNIQRSKYNGLVNISVLDNTVTGTPAKTVSIMGTSKNLLGQEKQLEFSEVKEGDAIYYLAQVSFRNEETLTFDITIRDGKETQKLNFKQKFYVD